MLRTLRELQELPKSDLVKLSGIRQPNISAMESGNRNIGQDVAATLRVPPPAVILFL